VRAIRTGEPQTPLSEDFGQNVRLVTKRLVDILQRLSGEPLSLVVQDTLPDLAKRAGLLALDIGSQRTCLRVETCHHRERPSSSDMFKDDSDGVPWSQSQVDLMTKPCLMRIGDGRDNFTEERVLVPGTYTRLPETQVSSG